MSTRDAPTAPGDVGTQAAGDGTPDGAPVDVADVVFRGYHAWHYKDCVVSVVQMLRTGVLASLVCGLTSIAVCAEDAMQLTCTGVMIEPRAMAPSPKTIMLTIGPAEKITLDLGQGVVNAREVSDNKIQLKFRTDDFEGEYFHYTGDLFFIYKSGHLMRLTCQKRAGP